MFLEKNFSCMLNRIRVRNITCFIASFKWMVVYNCSNCGLCWFNVACLLKEEIGGIHMTIVVKKVPKFLRGFVKFIFRIKS